MRPRTPSKRFRSSIKTQMQSKGWTRESWADLGEMQYGSFQKNNETRRCLIYVIQSEDKTGINILSTSK